MLAQRAAQQSLRRFAGQQHAYRFASPIAIATGNVLKAQRGLYTDPSQPISERSQHGNILAQQRLNRPVSPHLGIYQAQITWYLSALTRITGCTLSGAFYIFGSLYLIAPYIGLHMESAVMAASVAAWPVALKVFTKTLVALPLTFHTFNGVRHLMWDTANMITNKKVQLSGWVVVGLTVISSLALAFM